MIDIDGTNLEQITYDKKFASFLYFQMMVKRLYSLQIEIMEELEKQMYLLLIGLNR